MIKLCIDCKHCIKIRDINVDPSHKVEYNYACGRTKMTDNVDGSRSYLKCSQQRERSNECGVMARLYEKKPDNLFQKMNSKLYKIIWVNQ